MLNFRDFQTTLHERLKQQGHFAILCDHAQRHIVPPEAALAGWRFMQDHPYGVTPEPYLDGLPATIPTYCAP